MKHKRSHLRENFPNVEHYEFSETNLHSMNQLNALAQVGFIVTLVHVCVLSQVQGITSLTIGEEGNPLYAKNWRPYAIFRSPNSVSW